MSEDVSAGRLALDVVADTSGLRADLKAKLDAISRDLRVQVRAQVALDAQKAKADLDALSRDRTVKVTAKADTAAARADLDKTAAGRTAKITAKAETAQARADLDNAARDRTARIKAKTDQGSLTKTIQEIGGKLTAVSIPVAIGSGITVAIGAAGQLSGALVGVAAAGAQAAGVVGALPGLLLAAGQAAGSLTLGFSGIGKAVGAFQAAQLSAGTSAVSSARQVQAAQDTVRTSAQALGNAQISGAEQVASAQHAVRQAIIAVADAQYNAARNVTGAEHSYTDALFSEKQAQVALSQARADARQNLIQTSFSLRAAVLGEKQATLSLAEAKIHLTEINQSAAATPQQRQQALLDYQQAQLQADESKNTAEQAAQAKKKADKAGVSGSQQVLTALHSEQDAVWSLKDAAQAVARARIEAARSVADAIYAEKQAEQSLTDTRRTSAQQLLNAQISYREALQAAHSPILGVSAAQTTLNQAMAGLTPQGRALVAFIDSSIIPAYKRMQKATAAALLPGVTTGLKSALPVIGTVQRGLTGTGKVLGGVASRFGSWLGSAGVRSDLSGVMAVNAQALGRFGDAGIHVADALRNVSVAAEPLVRKVSEFADRIAKTADSLSKSGRESGHLAGFFDRAWHSAQQLWKIAGNLAGALGHLFGAAAPSGSSLLGSLVSATGKLDQWTGSAGGQARLRKFFTDTVPVARQFGDFLVRAAGVIGQLVSSFGGGQLNGLFTVLNLALTVLSTLVKLPGFGQVVQWVLLLASAGAGLGVVAGKIGAIGKGLSLLTKLSGLDSIAKALGLGDTAGGALGGGLKKAGKAILGTKAVAGTGFAVSAAGEAAAAEGTAATGLYAVPGLVASAGGALKSFAGTAGTAMASAGGAVVTFVAGLGTQLAAGARSVIGFAVEHTVAAAGFIAENVAMAVSATAAFIAENAATLGIIAGLIALVAGIVWVATHWRQVWGDIKNWAKDAWDFIYNGFGKYLLPLLGPAGLIILGIIEVAQHWRQIWADIKGAAHDAFHWIAQGASSFVSGLGRVWGTLENIFKKPVNFLIKTVYDNGIVRFWNDVVGAVGLSGSLGLKPIAGLARGGIVPGADRGRDEVLIAARPEEGVLVPGAVRAIGGPPAVHALNRAHGGGQPGNGTGFAGGGIVGGGIGGWLHGAWDIAKAVAALATGNTTAFVNALSPMISTPAAGNLAKLMLALPAHLMGLVAHGVLSFFAGGTGTPGGKPGVSIPPPSSNPGGKLTATVRQWFAKAVRLTGVPVSWTAPLETIAWYESRYNPSAVNNTPAGVNAGLPEGIMQTIGATFRAFHQAGTSSSIWDAVANIAAAIRYILAKYKNPENTPGLIAVNNGRPYTYYDQGGPLGPGPHSLMNATGRTEWVLTPQAVDLLGGPAAVSRLNMTAALYAGRPPAGTEASRHGTAPAGATVNVYPAPGMSEEHVGEVAARKLGFMLA